MTWGSKYPQQSTDQKVFWMLVVVRRPHVRSAVAAVSVTPAVVTSAVSVVASAAGQAPSPPAAAAVTSAPAAAAHAAAPLAAPLVHLHVRPIAGVGAPLKHNHRVDTAPNAGVDMRGAGIPGSSLKKIFEKSLYGLMGADA